MMPISEYTSIVVRSSDAIMVLWQQRLVENEALRI